MNENKYQRELVKRIKARFPGCIVLKNDPNYQQGIPDLSVFYKSRWAFLEVKKSYDDFLNNQQPNQDYYISKANRMSFGRFIYPENEEEVLDELEQTFQPRRNARISGRQ